MWHQFRDSRWLSLKGANWRGLEAGWKSKQEGGGLLVIGRACVLCQELYTIQWRLLRVLKLAKLLFLLAFTLVGRHGA